MKKILTFLFIIVMLSGCADKRSNEKIVEDYLEKKYKKDFVVEKLNKHIPGGGIGVTYSGMAYEEGKPLERFHVHFGSKNSIDDAYDRVYLLPELNNWISEETSKIWNCNAFVIMDVLRNNENKYSREEFKEFLKNESVSSDIYLIIKTDKISVEDYLKFDSVVKEYMDGYVKIFLYDNNKELSDYIDKEPNYAIYIGADEKNIREKFNQ